MVRHVSADGRCIGTPAFVQFAVAVALAGLARVCSVCGRGRARRVGALGLGVAEQH